MSDDDARADARSLRAVRDLGLLLFVAAALVAGLVHYGLARGDAEPAAAAASKPSASASAGSSSQPPAPAVRPAPPAPSTPPGAPTPAIPADPVTTTTAPVAVAVSCWNGAQAARKAQCSQPTGVAGLRWVFPSIDRRGMTCHGASRAATDDYGTVVRLECSARVGGQPVTIAFEQVASTQAATQSIERAYVGADRYTIRGARGGRRTWFDARGRPARATGYYQGYPYVATLFADTPQTVKYAWASLVHFRDPAAVRGIRG